jgi:hypothetical protein
MLAAYIRIPGKFPLIRLFEFQARLILGIY